MNGKYSLYDAVNYSFAATNYFYVSKCADFYIIVNQHISVWEKVDDELMLKINVFHNYDEPCHRFIKDKSVLKKAKVNLDRIQSEECYAFLRRYNIKKLKYDKIIDLAMPESIIKWEQTTSIALTIYNKLEILEKNGIDVYDLQFSIFESVFLETDIERTEELINEVDELYKANLATDLHPLFLSEKEAQYEI